MKKFYLEGYGLVEIYPMPFYMKPFAIACVLNKKIRCSLKEPCSGTIRHELVHVLQQNELSWPTFLCLYVWLWIRAGFSYERHPMEMDAREWAYDTDFIRKRPYRNWEKYR